MKLRLWALITLSMIILLGACDKGGSNPTPTNTPQSQATNPAQDTATPSNGAASPTAAPAEQPSATQAAQASPTAPATQAKEPLKLEQAQVETTDSTRQGVFTDERTLNLPAGFHVKVYAADLPGVRWLGLSPDGLVYATLTSAGKVVTLPDADKDGVADSVKTFADGLSGVHGIAFKDGAVYVATEAEIVRLQDTNGDGVADKRDVLADDLPTGGGHFTRTIAFGPDGKLYVAAGSSCNVCVESNPKRAAISRYSADGKFEKVFASGLRNAVGIVFNSITGELWATDNGRDNLGDNIPPETIYNVKEDTNYGWPFCYGDRVPDKTQDVPAGFCEKTGTPAVKMQAHSAPLGLAFYTGDQFPAQFKGDMFVAFHGSWNRSVPTGYKVVRIRFKDDQPDTSNPDVLIEDFATGWLVNGDVWGRPVDSMVAPNGNLLLTDDKANAIYSIYYAENAGP
jgi:glucose/arabinose dehydrogenase